MSTTWYIKIPDSTRNAAAPIRKLTGWKIHKKQKEYEVLTDGEHFIHCDTRPINVKRSKNAPEPVGAGSYAVLERFGDNYPMEEVIESLSGFSEHELMITCCDKCGSMIMSDELDPESDFFHCLDCQKTD